MVMVDERVLRMRACARGHERAQTPATPNTAHRAWTAELLVCERVLELARVRVHAVAAGGHAAVRTVSAWSAFALACGAMRMCGEGGSDGGTAWRYQRHVATGHAAREHVHTPTRVPTLVSVRVRAVAAGSDPLLALSDASAAYSTCAAKIPGASLGWATR